MYVCVCVCSGVCFSCDRGLEEACKCGKYLTQLVPAVSILCVCVCVRVCVCALKLACVRVSVFMEKARSQTCLCSHNFVRQLPWHRMTVQKIQLAPSPKQLSGRRGGTVRTTHLPYHHGGLQWHLTGPPSSTCWLKRTVVVPWTLLELNTDCLNANLQLDNLMYPAVHFIFHLMR